MNHPKAISETKKKRYIDNELVRAALTDEKAREQFGYELLRTAEIFVRAQFYGNNAFDIDDIVQDVCLNAIKSIEKFKFDRDYDLYFSRIVRNVIYDRYRKADVRTIGHMQDNVDKEGRCIIDRIFGGDLRTELIYRDAFRIVMEEVNAIQNPIHQKIALLWIEGLRAKDIIKEVALKELTEQNVYNVIFRTKTKLREVLGNML